MLDQLTLESFTPHVGSSFWAVFPNGGKVELVLRQAERRMESELARLKRTAFALYFDGPRSYLLNQGAYTIEHELFPEPQEIFLVPIGQTAEQYQYEAVFT
ncbi:MAG: hypothetical protein M3Q69_05905 [Acidobacteriota bacterium]|nr:hypothetical protein [Acidobacteriota bacterium]